MNLNQAGMSLGQPASSILEKKQAKLEQLKRAIELKKEGMAAQAALPLPNSDQTTNAGAPGSKSCTRVPKYKSRSSLHSRVSSGMSILPASKSNNNN